MQGRYFFKNFRFQIIFRVLLFCASIYIFFLLLLNTKLYATILIVGVISLFQIYALIRYIEKTNHDINRFFLAIKYDDFSQSFTNRGLGSSFKEITRVFNEVMKKFQKTRSESEEQYHYLQTVVQHVGIGLIAFKSNGDVNLINTAAKKLFKVAQLKNIKSLKNFDHNLVNILFQLKAGEKKLVKVGNRNELQQLVIYATEFRLKEQKYTLVSMQNIHGELEEKEIEAWQNLIRVLTHEIMNSITPISSLTATVIDLLGPIEEKKGKETEKPINTEKLMDINNALKTVHKRSQGLMHFVSSYRNLTLIPKPDFKVFTLEELFMRVEDLMMNKFKEKGIHFVWIVEPKTLELTADPGLVEQVLINLLLNSSDAVMDQENKRITLSVKLDERSRVMIKVIDNGSGIVEEALEKIFIPFFTTKKMGTGIGLSLSRQIMKLHHGTINVESTPNIKTVFTLSF